MYVYLVDAQAGSCTPFLLNRIVIKLKGLALDRDGQLVAMAYSFETWANFMIRSYVRGLIPQFSHSISNVETFFAWWRDTQAEFFYIVPPQKNCFAFKKSIPKNDPNVILF